MSEWIKVEHDTLDKPEVFQLADIFGVHPDEAVGMAVRWFRWVDKHVHPSEDVSRGERDDCHAPGVTRTLIEHAMGRAGFADALETIGWVRFEADGSAVIVGYAHHFGESSKKRAQARRRKRLQRDRESGRHAERDRSVTDGASLSRSKRDTCHAPGVTSARPEVRSENREKETTTTVDRAPSCQNPNASAGLTRHGVVVETDSGQGGSREADASPWPDRFAAIGVTDASALAAAARRTERSCEWILENATTNPKVDDSAGWATAALGHGYEPPAGWVSSAERRSKLEREDAARRAERERRARADAEARERCEREAEARRAIYARFLELGEAERRRVIDEIPAGPGSRSVKRAETWQDPPLEPGATLARAVAMAMRALNLAETEAAA